jgi:hypothetical protein
MSLVSVTNAAWLGKDLVMTESPQDVVPVPISWHIPEDLVPRYANNFVVQHTEQEFIISFFELLPPLMIGPADSVRARLEEMESMPARCVGRVILTPDRLKELLATLQDNLQKYNAKFGEEGASHGGNGSDA